MPTIPEAMALAGQAWRQGDRALARKTYEQVLREAPHHADALYALGVLAFEARDLSEAESYLQRALAVDPNQARCHTLLGAVHWQLGRAEEAIADSRKAVELDPTRAELHNNLGVALKQAGLLGDAVSAFRQSLAIGPTFDGAYNLANALAALDDLAGSEREFRRAIELSPREWEAHNNLGNILQTQGRLEEALACFEAALACREDAAEAHRNRALYWLLMGNYEQGWPEYEWRWRMPGHRGPDLTSRRWTGQPLAGRTLLLIFEQGLGDTIQFVRYAALVRRQHPQARVVLCCPDPWHPLLRTAPAIDQVVGPDAREVKADYCTTLLSLPGLFGTLLQTIPADVPYLSADAARVDDWRVRLASYPGLKVGIAWQGNPAYSGDRYRSVPLANLAPLAELPGVRLFSLQKGFGCEQLAAFPARDRVVDLGPQLDQATGTMVDTAAVMMNLDLVVTSDTALAHLAGALGVRVWVALQSTPNWRWLVGGRDSPWYPTMRLFRQSTFGDWPGVYREMAQAVASEPWAVDSRKGTVPR